MKPSTSFADALTVPQLAQACSHAARGSPSGLKCLREVSKQISIAMLAHVHSYTLRLVDNKQLQNLKAVPLLKRTRLSNLAVQVVSAKGKLTETHPAHVSSVWFWDWGVSGCSNLVI